MNTFKSTLEAFLSEQEEPKLTGIEAIKARVAAKVKKDFDKRDLDRVAANKRAAKQKEVDAFMKAHKAKMKQRIIQDKLEGKY